MWTFSYPYRTGSPEKAPGCLKGDGGHHRGDERMIALVRG